MRILNSVLRLAVVSIAVLTSGAHFSQAQNLNAFDLENGQFIGVQVGQHIFFSGGNFPGNVNVYWDNTLIGTYPGSSFTDCPLPNCNVSTPGLYQVTNFDNAQGPCTSNLRAVSGQTEVDFLLSGRILGVVAAADKQMGDTSVTTDGQNPVTGGFLCWSVGWQLNNGVPILNNIGVNPHSLLALDDGGGALTVVDNEVHVKTMGMLVHDGQTLYLGLLGDQLYPLSSNGVAVPPASAYTPPPGATALPGMLSCTSPGGCSITGSEFTSGSLVVTGTSGLNLQSGLLYVNGDLTIDGGVQGTGGFIVNGNVIIRGATNFQPSGSAAITAAGNIFLCGDGVYSGGPCASTPQCMFTIAPASVNVPATLTNGTGLSGMVIITASASSCPWTAVSNSTDLMFATPASGTGSGSVSYSVNPNPNSPRTLTATIATQTFTVNQAGPVTFTATGSNGKTTDVLNHDTISFSGANWLPTGGVVTVSVDNTPAGTFQPPNFSGSIVYDYNRTGTPPCTAQVTATQGTTQVSVQISGDYLGKVVAAEPAGAVIGTSPISPLPLNVGDQICKSNTIPDLLSYFPAKVLPSAALVIEGVSLPGAASSTVNLGGGVFVVVDHENSKNDIFVNGYVLVGAGSALTVPLAGGSKSFVSHATSPLPASLFTPHAGSVQLSNPLNTSPLTGFYEALGDISTSQTILLDNAVVTIAGNANFPQGLNGVGFLSAQKSLTIGGAVNLGAADQTALASMGNVTFGGAPVVGDVNSDGVVDCLDVAAVKASFGKRTGQPGFNPAADLNGDGVVDIRDLALVARALPAGTHCP